MLPIPDSFPQGLKKTCVTMDQERPRSDLSINSRNNLRKVLHLEFLYKENKVHACNVWRDVLELSLALSKQAWALPGRQRWAAGGGHTCGQGETDPTKCCRVPAVSQFQPQPGPGCPTGYCTCPAMRLLLNPNL